MSGERLREELRDEGVPAGASVAWDGPAALALIDRAERAYVAVQSVEPIGPDDLGSYRPPGRRGRPSDIERLRSWESARSFVTGLEGRGLYFDVVFESAWSTRLAKLRYLFRTGAWWTSPADARSGTIQ